jgi:cytochrome P450
MSAVTNGAPYWDPYDPVLFATPYSAYRRLREEAPIFYNEKYDFYAVSRADDVQTVLSDRDTYISRYGDVLEFIKGHETFPSGLFIFEDPPLHTIHRGLVNRIFTPAKMAALDGQIREYCAAWLDPLIGTGKLDFIEDLGTRVPMAVIGMMLGIPNEDLFALQKRLDASARPSAPGEPTRVPEDRFANEQDFGEYIDWRIKNPSDDLMTQFMNAEFIDETGITRKLTRAEISVYVNLFANAGNETTNRLIGWMGKLLSDYPEQRRQICENRGLLAQTIEEVLRYETPGGPVARFVAKDVEFHGKKVPKGSVMVALTAAANRDDRRFKEGDRFDIHRERRGHFSFGTGFHSCLGNALARVEGRIVLEEVLNRFPDWVVDLDNAKMVLSSTTRGWEKLPVFTH